LQNRFVCTNPKMPADSSRLETQAVEVERALNQLQRQIDRYRTLPPRTT
jgi:hypothetical protein